jgi:hypothetical protein
LVEVTGDLTHKRPGWKEYLPLSFGTRLDRGDLLKAAPDAEGLVVCADLSLAPVPAGYQGGLPCPRTKPIIRRGESYMIGPQRERPLTVSIPYILSPRHTFIQTPYPLLRWHPSTAETITYTVRVWGGDLDWWTETTAAELRYPDDAPPLAPKTPYYLTVVDAERRSSEEEQTTLDVSFSLLPTEELEAVRAMVAQARTLGLDERATQLLEMEIYAAHGLRAGGIAGLEELAAQENAPAIQQRLGDLYLEVGLYAEAREAYGRAQVGYRALGDHAGEAAALAGLGLAYRGNHDETTARGYLEQALDLYQVLGDAEGMGCMENVLAEIRGDQ